MAGLPPEYGLYGALVPGLVYTLFGECPASAIGPYPTVSLALIDAIIIVHPGTFPPFLWLPSPSCYSPRFMIIVYTKKHFHSLFVNAEVLTNTILLYLCFL